MFKWNRVQGLLLRAVFVVITILAVGLLLAASGWAAEVTGVVCACAFPAGVILRSPYEDDGGGGLGVMPEEQFRKKVLNGVEAVVAKTNKLEVSYGQLESQVRDLRRGRLSQAIGASNSPHRATGKISDDAAQQLAYDFILNCERRGRLETLIRSNDVRAKWLREATSFMGTTQRALSTTEVPLPTTYGRELTELIAELGVVRKNMRRYPMSGGTDKPPRMGTRPAFQAISMAAAFPELKPTLGFATLTPHKIGGIVIPPREITEQSAVDFGNYLALYGAVEFARAEDTWGFLADGSETYEGIKGVRTVCVENSKYVRLASGKTKPSDATLDSFRALRGKVSTAALAGGKYYLNQTWEQALRAFNTSLETPFVYRPDGQATFDGFPIVWTEVSQPYGTTAAALTLIAAFGRLDFWWLGEYKSPRIDTSADVYFANDLIATRFIEELDFDYNALDSMAVLETAAS